MFFKKLLKYVEENKAPHLKETLERNSVALAEKESKKKASEGR